MQMQLTLFVMPAEEPWTSWFNASISSSAIEDDFEA